MAAAGTGQLAKGLGIGAGLGAFGIWMWVVDNPRVAETAIGLVIGVAVGFVVYRRLAR